MSGHTFTQNYLNNESIIQKVLDSVSVDSLCTTVRDLTGEQSIQLDGQSITITSRHKNYPGNEHAAKYLENKLEEYGYKIKNQSFSSTGKNVVGVKKGIDFPDQEYIICAHYDATSSSNPKYAPGADDNASGTAAVLEAARVLAHYNSKYTLLAIFWDEEEQYMIGSKYYAKKAKENNQKIKGLLNMDMIGYHTHSNDLIQMHESNVGQSKAMGAIAKDINTTHSIDMTFIIKNPPEAGDHIPFVQNGFSAICIEENGKNNFNPYYHSANDKIQHFNKPYFCNIAKISIGTIATLIEISEASPITKKIKKPIAQSPKINLTSSTISFHLHSPSSLNISLYNIKGKCLYRFNKYYETVGKQRESLPITLPQGYYIIKEGLTAQKAIVNY